LEDYFINYKIFNLIGDVNIRLEEEFSRFINGAIENPETPIVIAIDSPGGHTDIGFSIHNKIRAIPNPVYVIITGACHSIANVILMAVPYERRFAFNYTSFFMHPASTGLNRDLRYSSEELRNELNVLTEININIYDVLKSETKIPCEKLASLYLKQTGELKIYYKDFENYEIAKLITKYDEIFKEL